MDLPRELGDLLGELLVLTRQLRVRLEEPGQLVRLAFDRGHALLREADLLLVVLLGPVFESLVPVGLAGLGEQDQRRRIGGLGREREVEQDERVGIPAAGDANALRITQAMTTIDWPMMYCGVPKKRAMRSAIRPNVSTPKAPRCSCTATAAEA